MKLANKHKFIVLYVVAIELVLQGMSFAAQNSKPLNLMTLPTAIQTHDPFLKLSVTVNNATKIKSDFFSSLKFPLPPGIRASFEPTTQPDGSTEPTNCPDGSVVPSLCLGGLVPTVCKEYIGSTECPDEIQATFCQINGESVRFPTICQFFFPEPTHCQHDEGSPTLATTCEFDDKVISTYCEYEDDPNVNLPTNCPNGETLPTNCPDQKNLAQTNCSGDDGDDGEPTQCADGSIRPTFCQLGEGQIKIVPTFCPPSDDPEIWPTHCLHEENSPIPIPTYCQDESLPTECPNPDLPWIPTHCHQDGLPPLVTTRCPDGETYHTNCPNDPDNPTYCIDGENVCDY